MTVEEIFRKSVGKKPKWSNFEDSFNNLKGTFTRIRGQVIYDTVKAAAGDHEYWVIYKSHSGIENGKRFYQLCWFHLGQRSDQVETFWSKQEMNTWINSFKKKILDIVTKRYNKYMYD